MCVRNIIHTMKIACFHHTGMLRVRPAHIVHSSRWVLLFRLGLWVFLWHVEFSSFDDVRLSWIRISHVNHGQDFHDHVC